MDILVVVFGLNNGTGLSQILLCKEPRREGHLQEYLLLILFVKYSNFVSYNDSNMIIVKWRKDSRLYLHQRDFSSALSLVAVVLVVLHKKP